MMFRGDRRDTDLVDIRFEPPEEVASHPKLKMTPKFIGCADCN